MGFLELFLIGVGLSMDAFAVAVCQGLCMPRLNLRFALVIALFFGGFQALMPFAGWLLGAQFAGYIQQIDHWLAFGLLAVIGGKMLWEGVRHKEDEEAEAVSSGGLLLQGVATSIDALSVGFTIAEYGPWMAVACAAVIAAVTFVICTAGLVLGRTFGTRLAGKASILGGAILIFIGLEIFVSSLL